MVVKNYKDAKFVHLEKKIENFHASGRRRQMSSVSADDEKQDLIERLTNYIDQQARRKFQQQLHQKHQQQMVSAFVSLSIG